MPLTTCPVRPAEAADAPFLAALFDDVRAPELAGLDAATLRTLLDLQHTAQRQQYAAAYPAAVDHLIVHGDRPVGRLLLDASAAETRIVDVAVLTAERGRGAGTAALTWCCAEADEASRALTLTMAPHNPAERLYRRLGFEIESAGPTAVALRRTPGRTSDV